MGEGAVSEGHVSAVDMMQIGGPVPLEDVFEDGMPWYSFWSDANGGW